jgi:hypothetical protein
VQNKLSGFGRSLGAYTAILIGAVVLCWIAFKVIAGFVHTLVIIAIIIFALYALNWGLGARKGSD